MHAAPARKVSSQLKPAVNTQGVLLEGDLAAMDWLLMKTSHSATAERAKSSAM
jgi:hypothetical protein